MNKNKIPPFYLGQQVVCLRGKEWLTTNEVYTVRGLRYFMCCGFWVVDVGIASHGFMGTGCSIHGLEHTASRDGKNGLTKSFSPPSHQPFKQFHSRRSLKQNKN